MPVGGTLERIVLEVGDVVAQGDVLAQVNKHDLEQQLRGLESLIAQAQAKMTGVDVEKPKMEDESGRGERGGAAGCAGDGAARCADRGN